MQPGASKLSNAALKSSHYARYEPNGVSIPMYKETKHIKTTELLIPVKMICIAKRNLLIS